MIAVQREKESLIGLAIDAFAQIFAPTTGFLTASVMDILFNGIGIDCNHSEFEAQALCSLLDSEGKGIKTVNATYKTFSVFGTVIEIFSYRYYLKFLNKKFPKGKR